MDTVDLVEPVSEMPLPTLGYLNGLTPTQFWVSIVERFQLNRQSGHKWWLARACVQLVDSGRVDRNELELWALFTGEKEPQIGCILMSNHLRRLGFALPLFYNEINLTEELAPPIWRLPNADEFPWCCLIGFDFSLFEKIRLTDLP